MSFFCSTADLWTFSTMILESNSTFASERTTKSHMLIGERRQSLVVFSLTRRGRCLFIVVERCFYCSKHGDTLKSIANDFRTDWSASKLQHLCPSHRSYFRMQIWTSNHLDLPQELLQLGVRQEFVDVAWSSSSIFTSCWLVLTSSSRCSRRAAYRHTAATGPRYFGMRPIS